MRTALVSTFLGKHKTASIIGRQVDENGEMPKMPIMVQAVKIPVLDFESEIDFHVVNAALALDLAFSLLCELLQLWGQTGAGVSVLLKWLLKEDDLNDLKSTTVMGNDYLFDKGKTNFWAEKLTEVRQLSKHLLLLIPVIHVSSCEQRKLCQLARLASDQAQLVTQLLKEMPPTPEFSQSVEFTKLAIQNERISLCLKILSLLEVGNGICKS